MGLIVAGLKNKVIKCEGELTNGWGILGIFNFGMVLDWFPPCMEAEEVEDY